jgi:phosphinothricin acetyltransferase
MDKIIRRAGPADATAIRDIYAPFVSESATSFEAEAPDAEAMARRIEELGENFPWLVYEGAGEVLGYAYAAPHRAARKAYQWCVETSIYVHARGRGRGIGRALYASLFELLRRQGYVNAYAGITLPNPASRRLHESMGFVPVGVYPRIGFKFGAWHDVLWLQLRLQETAEPAAKLLPAKELFGQTGVRALLEDYARRAG